MDFCQNDLVSDDVMVLDAYRAIFVWVGEGANKAEKSESIKLVQEYLESGKFTTQSKQIQTQTYIDPELLFPLHRSE